MRTVVSSAVGLNNVNGVFLLFTKYFLFLVAPESIHRHVKTCKQEAKNRHFIAPEYGMNVNFKILLSPFR